MQRPKVIAIRAGPHPMAARIYRRLDEGGIDHVEVAEPRDVPPVLGEDGANAVVVFNATTLTPAPNQAQELLRLLRKSWSTVPVVVVVEKTSFDEYYELMCEGAYDYYELAEGPEVIAEALRWAAHTHATPPRVLGAEPGKQVGSLTVGVA